MKVQEIIRNDGFSPFVGEVLHIAHNQTMPYVVTDAQKLTVEIAAGVRTHVVLLHTVAHEATVNIALAEGATLAVSEIFIAEAFVDMTLTQASQSTCTLFVAELTSANVSYRFALDGDHAECTMNGLFLAADAEH
ncbi:MAG: SufD family Fe-S cluster assembly protein, partial [Alistipes sp.]